MFDPAGNSDNGALGYTYDTVGNRLQMSSNVSVLPPSSVSYSYDGNDQLSTDLYDLNRNTTSSGGVSNIKYDFENHMTSYGTTTFTKDEAIAHTVEFAKAMKQRDPSIRLIGWGDRGRSCTGNQR